MQKNVYAVAYPIAVDEGLGQLAVQTDFATHAIEIIARRRSRIETDKLSLRLKDGLDTWAGRHR